MRHLVPCLLLAGLSAASCTDLPDIADHVCGNAILEIDRGEECDTFSEAGQHCRAAGQPAECRFDCTRAADGSAPSCPTGLGCGQDGVCRKASSQFEKLGGPLGDGEAAVFLGDFDGDGRKDLLSEGAQVLLHFFDEGGGVGASLQIPAYPAIPAIGRFTEEAFDDFTVSSGFGVGLLRGRADRTASPLSFSTISLNTLEDSYILELDALTDVDHPLDETLVIASQGKLSAVFAIDPAGGAKSLFALPAPASELAGEVAIADLVPSTPCQDVAFGYKGGTELRVGTPCKSASEFAGPQDQPPPVALPAGTSLASGPFAVDLDGDGFPDLAAGTTCSPGTALTSCVAIVVSFGDAQGGFHSDRAGPSDHKASIFATFDSATFGTSYDMTGFLPLAVGELSGDKMFDVVCSLGILLNFGVWSPTPQDGASIFGASAQGDGLWTTAVIRDLNGNGIPDVIAASNARTGLDFMNGAGGGFFNPFLVATHGKTRHLAVGDFDGDLILDVALAETGDPNATGEAVEDSLSIAFGHPTGAPAAPVSRGRLGTIQRIAVGDVYDFGLDAMSDLVAISSHATTEPDTLALFAGTSDRQLEAPLILFRQEGSLQRYRNDPKAVAMGGFDGDAHPDLAVLAQEQIAEKGGGTTPGGFRLWHVPSAGGGQVDITKAGSIPMPAGFGYDSSVTRVVPIDLDANGTLELVVTGYDDAAQSGALYLGRVVNGAWTLTPKTLPAGTAFGYSVAPALITAPGKRTPDVLTIRSTYDPASKTVTAALVLLPNDGAGGFAVDKPIVVPQGPDPGFVAAPIQADADPEQELVVLSANAAYLVNYDRFHQVFSAMVPIAGAPGGVAVAAGDMDGDGIDDIAIATTSGVQIMKGVPVNK